MSKDLDNASKTNNEEENIPKRGEKKIQKKEFSLDKFKEKMNISDNDIKEKPLRFIKISDSLKKAIGFDIPLSNVTLFRGYSNTGKSTALYETAVACQRDNILPIIIDTENSIKTHHLKSMGFDFEKPYLIVDNDYLLENYGKLHDKKIRQATIEDMAEFCNNIMDMQESGELEMDIFFLVDSIGTLDCRKSVAAQEKDSNNNNQWNAGAMAASFKNLLNNRIPSTAKVNRKYTASWAAVQKVWFDSQSGAGVLRNSGGEAAYSASRIIVRFGGIQSHGSSKVIVTKNKKSVQLGVATKVTVDKNHVTGVAFDGNKIISTPHGFIDDTSEAIAEYKRQYSDYIDQLLDDYTDAEIDVTKEEVKDVD